jgi:hypothetical protein
VKEDFERALGLYPERLASRGRMVRKCELYDRIEENLHAPAVQPPARIDYSSVVTFCVEEAAMTDLGTILSALKRPGERPCGFKGGDPNLRRYVRNDPIDATDPTGTTIRDVEFHGLLSDDQKKFIRNALEEDDKAVSERVAAVIVEIGKALANPQPRGAANADSAQAVVARLQQKGGALAGRNGAEVDAFVKEYEWALNRTKERLEKIRTEMGRGYVVGYWAYGEKNPKDNSEVRANSRGFCYPSIDYAPRRINITEARFDPTHPDVQGFKGAAQIEALAGLRRGTILHELSHLVWDTYDDEFHYEDNEDPDRKAWHRDNWSIKWRFLDDAYWYGGFYQTGSMQNDFSKNMDFLIKDIARPEYIQWLIARGPDWNARHPDTKTNPELGEPPWPRP